MGAGLTSTVVVLDDYQDVALRFGPWDRVAGRASVSVEQSHLIGDALVSRLADADIVIAMRERTAFPRDLLARLPRLRLLVTTGMVNASIDVEAAHELGVTVCGTASLPTPPAELTWGLILALARGICLEHASIVDGGWQRTVGLELAGRTLGVVGLGRLGTQVATVGVAFGMRVLAWSQHLDADAARAQGAEPVSKERLLAESDVVTLHLKLSDRSRGVIGAAELAAMKPSAFLVNTSRGPLVDGTALLAALQTASIAGAGLDVFDEEPLPTDHPLRSAPNVVLTPHIGYVTQGTYDVFFRDAVDDIEAFLDGRPVREL